MIKQNSLKALFCNNFFFFYSVNEVLFLRLLRYYLVTFQATQLLSYAYTIHIHRLGSLRYNKKLRFQSRVKLGLRFKICNYAYHSKYILTRTFLNPSRFPPPSPPDPHPQPTEITKMFHCE